MRDTLSFDEPDEPEAPSTPAATAGHLAPLAARMRPRSLDEYVGQPEALGEGTPLRAALDAWALPTSLVLWGPPGTGKTSLASVISRHVRAVWSELSAVTAGVRDVRRVIDEGRARAEMTGRRTILFIDEVHRFTKAQQDALLPGVEAGWVTLIGATTENPFFELNAPLLSRCRLVRLEPLTDDDLRTILASAVEDERGLGGTVTLTDEAVAHLVEVADGDARTLLTALEVATSALGERTEVGPADVDVALKRFRYDRAADQHYDITSAFIKSLRGSDPDAALYWMFRMLAAGEDPRFIARRMVILASEDVGLADRGALPLAVAAFDALDKVGLPEAEYALAHAAVGLATAPKSNSITRAMVAAKALVHEAGNAPVPAHLRDAHYRSARRLGHGVGYDYPHDHPGGYVDQRHMPDGLDRVLYEPTTYGHEAVVAERLARWRGTHADTDTTDGSAQ
jgi:putative ATPase